MYPHQDPPVKKEQMEQSIRLGKEILEKTLRRLKNLSLLDKIDPTFVAVAKSDAVFAEIIFSRPGLGKLIFVAVQQRNFPLIMGTVLVTTTLFVVATTLSDIVNALLDPRIRERL